MAYLHGEFRNTNNDLIRVEMKSPEGVAEYVIDEDTSQIHFAGDPIEITSECDSLFEVIIKKSAKITLVTTHYLGEYLFAANEKSVTVKIYKNDVIIFDGYVEPNTFSQPWAYEYETFDINCIDKLSCLQYEYPCRQTEYRTYKEQNNVYSFKKYLSDILPANTYWDNSKTTDGQPFDKNIFDMLGVSLNVFLGEDEEDMMNNEEILFEILQYLNLHIIQEGEDFIIFDWKSIY